MVRYTTAESSAGGMKQGSMKAQVERERESGNHMSVADDPRRVTTTKDGQG